MSTCYFRAVLSDEQIAHGYPWFLLNDKQMSNKVGVEHQNRFFRKVDNYIVKIVFDFPCIVILRLFFHVFPCMFFSLKKI